MGSKPRSDCRWVRRWGSAWDSSLTDANSGTPRSTASAVKMAACERGRSTLPRTRCTLSHPRLWQLIDGCLTSCRQPRPRSRQGELRPTPEGHCARNLRSRRCCAGDPPRKRPFQGQTAIFKGEDVVPTILIAAEGMRSEAALETQHRARPGTLGLGSRRLIIVAVAAARSPALQRLSISHTIANESIHVG